MGPEATSSEHRLTTLHVAELAERSIDQALGVSRALTRLAKESGAAVLATSLVRGPAWVIGSRQRRSRFDETVSVVRRPTTGTAAFVRETALWHALALPCVNALFADATPRTLLNRNVRGFLRGYRGLGIKANWGGREYFRAVSTPLGLLGCDLLADGAVLIEACVGIEASSIVAASGGAGTGAALRELTDADPERVADAVSRGVADKYGLSIEPFLLPEPRPAEPEGLEPAGFVEVIVPIGRLEAAFDRTSGVSIRGDVLTSNAALAAVEERATSSLSSGGDLSVELVEPLRDAPFDGAVVEDVLALLKLVAMR
jgi:hypothetical protein